jgi:hypothetical protein
LWLLLLLFSVHTMMHLNISCVVVVVGGGGAAALLMPLVGSVRE